MLLNMNCMLASCSDSQTFPGLQLVTHQYRKHQKRWGFLFVCLWVLLLLFCGFCFVCLFFKQEISYFSCFLISQFAFPTHYHGIRWLFTLQDKQKFRTFLLVSSLCPKQPRKMQQTDLMGE